jgi:hypothetical protein
MDYDALAKKYGGADAAPVIDYDALAKQYGGADMSAPQPTGMPGPRKSPSALTQFGRSAASLADVTVGGVIPGAVQYLAYPFARVGRSPEEAQAITQGLVGAVDKPFGKAFGVSDTPEYQQEAGRQVMDFIGQNFQKGAKWISSKTGIPEADVESYLATATLTAPKVVPPVVKAVKQAVAPAVEKAKIGLQMPFEPMLQKGRERRSAESYAKAPQLDAIAEAQRLKLALNPVDIENSISARAYSAAAGPRGPEALAKVNQPRVTEIAKNELGIDSTTSLTSDSYKQARANLAAPYDEVRKLPTMVADETTIKNLNDLRRNENLLGDKGAAKKVNKEIDKAIANMQQGLTGSDLLDSVRNLRAEAKQTYKNPSAKPKDIAAADANLAIANQLESMIESNISNPKLLDQFRDARQKMARSYVYEEATNFNTGQVDASKLARITAKDNALTGDIKSIGVIAGNNPEAFTTQVSSKFVSVPRLTRSGLGGAGGALIGSPFGMTGSLIGMGVGSVLGEFGGGLAAKRMASPNYQAGLTLQDYRIPTNQLAAAAAPIPQNRAVVPYDPNNALVQPNDIVGYAQDGTPITAAQAFSRPNFTMPRQGPQPEVRTGVQPTPPQLPAPSAEGTINALRAEDVRRGGMSRTLGQQAEAQQAAAEAAARKPAGRGAKLVFDNAGNLVEAPVTGTTLTPTSLESAIQKLTGQIVPETSTSYKTTLVTPKSGAKPYYRITPKEGETTFERGVSKAFDLTATEKIAWEKTKVDLAEAAPDLKGLSDKAIAQKMMDREWVAQAYTKAREKAAMFDELAQRGANEQIKRAAAIERDKAIDGLEMLDERLRAMRPDVSGKQQGPKTRAAKRNALAPDNQNNLNQIPKVDVRGFGSEKP